ncbi:MAG TPA: NDP-sugar synthase [Acidimicrobiales bacterium]|nr:NDP-sugar synthase [Acidimicrobiales bacterium]
MRAVVLVGGAGTRLRPLTLTVPKQVLPIVEVPMIERVLGHLAKHGVTEAILSLGYRPESFLAVAPHGQVCGLTISHAVEPEPLGTAGAVRFAAREAGIDERFVVVNGDVLTDLDLGVLVEFHDARGGEATIALTTVDDASAFGLVSTDEDGRVRAFVEKPADATHSHGGDVNAGTYVLEPSVLDRIPDGRAVSIERDVFPLMAADGVLFASVSDAYWTDTGTPERYLQAHLDLIGERRAGAPVKGAVAGPEGVWSHGNAVVKGEVVGPAFLGVDVVVEAGAHVSRSVLGSGVVVRAGAQVRDSVLLPRVIVEADAVIEQCLVGEAAVIGEKSRLSELTVVGPAVHIDAGSHLSGARVPSSDPLGTN